MTFRIAVDANRIGDEQRARRLAEEVLSSHSDDFNRAQALTLLASLAANEGDRNEATKLYDLAHEAAARIGFTWWQIHALQDAAEHLLEWGRLDEAAARLKESFQLAAEIADRQGLVYGLALAAVLLAARGQVELSGRSWGAVEAEEKRSRIGQWELERARYEQKLADIGSPEFESGRTAGRSLSLDAAVDLALSALD